MFRRNGLTAALAALMALAGCEQPLPTFPVDASAGPRFAVTPQDPFANPFFLLMPPLVAQPPAPGGIFDATLLDQLSIDIFALDAQGTPQGSALKSITAQSGRPAERLQIDVTNCGC